MAFSHDSSSDSIPSVDEIVSSLSGLRGDLSHLSDLKSVEDQVVDPVELGVVESAHVTPEGSLIYYHDGGEIGSLDLSQYDNRDVLVDVVRDLAPKLREILENPPKVEEPVIEEPEPEPELVVEEPMAEEPVIEELVMEEVAEVEEPAVEEEPVTEEPQVMEEPVAEEVQEGVIEEAVEPPTPEPTPETALTERPLAYEGEFKPEPEKKEPRDRNVDLLWAVLKGQRIDSFREIRDYRAKRKEENGKLLKALRKRKGHEIEDHRSFFDRLKDAFTRRRKEKE
jgi:hypothetical protein